MSHARDCEAALCMPTTINGFLRLKREFGKDIVLPVAGDALCVMPRRPGASRGRSAYGAVGDDSAVSVNSRLGSRGSLVLISMVAV